MPAKVNDQTVLAYEINITNLFSREISVDRIEVLGGRLCQRADCPLPGEQPDTGDSQYGPPSPPADARKIPAGLRAVVYLWVTFDESYPVPLSLSDKLSFSVPTSDGKIEDRHLDLTGLEVSRATPLVIPAPFRGGLHVSEGTWIAGNAPADKSTHRRAATLA